MGSVVTIHRVSEPRGPAEQLEEANLIAGFGLEGDSRPRRGEKRQVTLIEEEALQAVAETLGTKAIPPGASRRQIMVRGIRLDALVGRRLRVGEAIVEGTLECRPCSRMEETIGPGGREAMEGRGGLLARVIEGGRVRVGDAVEAVEDPKVEGAAQVVGGVET